MGRRQVVESVNSALKGAFADLSRGFFRVFGRVKMTMLLGFTLAGFSLDRIRSFRAKRRLESRTPSAERPSSADTDGPSAAQGSGPSWWTRGHSRRRADQACH